MRGFSRRAIVHRIARRVTVWRIKRTSIYRALRRTTSFIVIVAAIRRIKGTESATIAILRSRWLIRAAAVAKVSSRFMIRRNARAWTLH